MISILSAFSYFKQPSDASTCELTDRAAVAGIDTVTAARTLFSSTDLLRGNAAKQSDISSSTHTSVTTLNVWNNLGNTGIRKGGHAVGQQHHEDSNLHAATLTLEQCKRQKLECSSSHASDTKISVGEEQEVSSQLQQAVASAAFDCSAESEPAGPAPAYCRAFLDACQTPELQAAVSKLVASNKLPYTSTIQLGTECSSLSTHCRSFSTASSLDVLLCHMLLLCHRSGLSMIFMHPEVMLTVLWIVESVGNQLRSRPDDVLKDYLDYTSGCRPSRQCSSAWWKQQLVRNQTQLLQATNWRVHADDESLQQAFACLSMHATALKTVKDAINAKAFHRCQSLVAYPVGASRKTACNGQLNRLVGASIASALASGGSTSSNYVQC